MPGDECPDESAATDGPTGRGRTVTNVVSIVLVTEPTRVRCSRCPRTPSSDNRAYPRPDIGPNAGSACSARTSFDDSGNRCPTLSVGLENDYSGQSRLAPTPPATRADAKGSGRHRVAGMAVAPTITAPAVHHLPPATARRNQSRERLPWRSPLTRSRSQAGRARHEATLRSSTRMQGCGCQWSLRSMTWRIRT